jgi:hypothetical protein
MYGKMVVILMYAFVPMWSVAQSTYQVNFGGMATVSGKYSILDPNSERYTPPGAIQLVAAVYIEDKEPTSLSLLLKLGLSYDNDNYLVNNSYGLSARTAQYNLILNPEILFPLANQKLKIGTGLGVEYLLKKTLWVNGVSGSSINQAYYYGNMDQKQRNIIPFVNFNFWFLYSPRVWFGFGIKQPLLTSYYSDQNITFDKVDFRLKHQPTYLNVSMFYVLK